MTYDRTPHPSTALLKEGQLMTDTDAAGAEPNAEPMPPENYGNGNEWADDGPWYVPEDLRPYYATAEPNPVMLDAYLQNGVEVVEDHTAEVERVQDLGGPDRAPSTVTGTITRPTLVHKGGAAFFPTWLHRVRLTRATADKNSADAQAAREAAYLVCRVCEDQAHYVKSHHLPQSADYVDRVHVHTCPAHRLVVRDALATRLAARDAERVLPDGRRAGDVAADIARDLIGE